MDLRYLVSFFLNGNSSVIEFETLEITHPSFSQRYLLVRNSRLGLTATLETSEVVTFVYLPLQVKKANDSDDLEQAFTFSLGDLGEILPIEMDRVAAADTFNVKPTVIYRTFRSDDLSAPMRGPFKLQMYELPTTDGGAAFEARPPTINNARTGEIYSLARFPSLRGFL